MPINSRAKGARWERNGPKLVMRIWPSLAGTLRRGIQFTGGPGSHDIAGLDGICNLEHKHTERFDIYGAMEQAASDCAPGELPALHIKKNRKPSLFVCYATDTKEFVRRFSEFLEDMHNDGKSM